MRRAARSEVARATPPRDAIRFRSAEESRIARFRPPRRPSTLAIRRAFTDGLYLALSILSNAGSCLRRARRAEGAEGHQHSAQVELVAASQCDGTFDLPARDPRAVLATEVLDGRPSVRDHD